MLSTAIFDLGNVVFRVNFDPMLRLWSDASGVSPKLLRERFVFDETLEAFECGLIEGHDYYRHISSQLDMQLSYEDWLLGWNSIYEGVIPEAEDALRRLRGKVLLAAFTNTNELHCPEWLRRYESVLSYFDHVFISSRLKLRKPQHQGFQRVLSECGVQPHEAIFFDDWLPNVAAAKELGIHAVHVDTPAAIPAALEEYGFTERSIL